MFILGGHYTLPYIYMGVEFGLTIYLRRRKKQLTFAVKDNSSQIIHHTFKMEAV